jgi:hypothetical protein
MCLYGYDNVEGIAFNGTIFRKAKGTRGGEKFDYLREVVSRSKDSMQAWYINTLYWLDNLEHELEELSTCSDSDDVLVAFPMNTTSCSDYFGCQFKDFCGAWKNPLQHCAEPPIGLIQEFWNPMEEKSKVIMNLKLGEVSEVVEAPNLEQETNEP